MRHQSGPPSVSHEPSTSYRCTGPKLVDYRWRSCTRKHLDRVRQHAAVSRRAMLMMGSSTLYCMSEASCAAADVGTSMPLQNLCADEGVPDYSGAGPLTPVRLPRLEHTCINCFPACPTAKCRIKLNIWYPKGGATLGLSPPYPLAILTAGFLVDSLAYQSYAEMLASWGYTAVLYDKSESAFDTIDDVLSVRFLTDVIDWAEVDPVMRRLADTGRVYLIGHSRGGKISALAASVDPRVAALCLIDPVDNTIYAPLGPGFPSAVAALKRVPAGRHLPVAIIGSGMGGDCVPVESNYRRFYNASQSAALELIIRRAGHFQFVDRQTPLQRAICTLGPAPDDAVRRVTQCVMVAWGENMLRCSESDPLRLAVNGNGMALAARATVDRAIKVLSAPGHIRQMLNLAASDIDSSNYGLEYRVKNINLLSLTALSASAA